ncbi:acetate kinase [Ophiostoma piceae UAMH 11346]|uniref:Acetate kinase n=1 Tax=Ophiostoma piceae (strain UAMH 11346) TaxID=1262450 RepID=S3C6S8_OPHP1|nr:acetate kinase [Ophiostoma piceae UAMH 11346]
MELYLSFLEPHRIRYVTNDHTIVHDDHIEVKYEFTTTVGSHRFQSELRGQDLVDHFDFDVIWSDKDSRTDSFGSVRGVGSIQRMKMWRDKYTTYHYLTFYANRTDRRYREYLVYLYEADIKNRDDSHRRLRLTVRGRRGSAPDSASQSNASGSHSSRRFSMASLRQRPRTSSQHHDRHHGSSHSSVPRSNLLPPTSAISYSLANGLDIRYLSIQFSRPDDYYRFIEQWTIAQNADGEFGGVPFPSDCFELPSPEILPGDGRDIYTSTSVLELPIMEEPSEGYDPRNRS